MSGTVQCASMIFAQLPFIQRYCKEFRIVYLLLQNVHVETFIMRAYLSFQHLNIWRDFSSVVEYMYKNISEIA